MKGAICQKGKYNTEELNKERKLKDLKEITNEEDELRRKRQVILTPL